MIREIVSANDAALPHIREIYENSFPPEERLDDWFFTEGLDSRAHAPRPGQPLYHLMTVGDRDAAWGFAAADYFPQDRDGSPLNLGFLVYLAVDAPRRDCGNGGLLYAAALDLLAVDARFWGTRLAGMAFTVERPDAAGSAVERSQRERRIAFYRRQGAELLESVLFENPPLREGEESIPLHLMYHPLAEPDWPAEDLHRTLHRLITGLAADRAARG